MTVLASPGGSCACLADALSAAWSEDPRVAVVTVGADARRASEALAVTEEATTGIDGVTDGRVVLVAPVPVPAEGRPATGGAVAGLLGGQTRALALAAAPLGTVNGVLHGPIADANGCGPDCAAGSDDERAAAGSAAMTGRLVTMDEVLATVSFLASTDAGYVTGTVITVDGGVNIGRHA